MIKLTPELYNSLKKEFKNTETGAVLLRPEFEEAFPFWLCDRLQSLSDIRTDVKTNEQKLRDLEKQYKSYIENIERDIADIRVRCPHYLKEHHSCYEESYDECLICGADLNRKV